MNTPLLFNGSPDQAESWLSNLITGLNQESELIEVEIEDEGPKLSARALIRRDRLSLEPMPNSMGIRRLKLAITTQVEDKLYTSDIGHLLITPLPRSTKLEMVTLEGQFIRERLEDFWKTVRERMLLDVVLIEPSQEPDQNEEKLDKLLPKKANGFRSKPETREQKILVLAVYDSQPAGQKESWLRKQFGGTQQEPSLPPSTVRSWRRRPN